MLEEICGRGNYGEEVEVWKDKVDADDCAGA
jgi:hypothetical protein